MRTRHGIVERPTWLALLAVGVAAMAVAFGVNRLRNRAALPRQPAVGRRTASPWLLGADLTDARYDLATRWPPGFDARKHRAVLVGGVAAPLAPRARMLAFVDWRGRELQQADLTGADLHGANLAGAILASVDLMRADLRGSD